MRILSQLTSLALTLGAAAWLLGAGAPQDGAKPQDAPAAKPAAEAWKGEPYMLATCAASGRPLDVKGTRTTKVVGGYELKFCCGGCAEVVAKDPAKWVEKVDKAHADQQRAIYPLATCVVAGESLTDDDGKDVATEIVVGNRLFRVCCAGCAKKVKADPASFAAKLDAAAKEAQAKTYPLKTCVMNPKAEVSADSTEFVVAGRLLRTCCGRCKAKVLEAPYDYVMAVDAARAAAAKPSEEGSGKGE